MSSEEIRSTHRDPWDEPRRGRRGAGSRLLIGVGIALVVLVGGSAAFAFSALRGGGAQPEEALPSTALAFAKVDLDPSAGQKIQAARFLSKLPDTGLDLDEESLEDADLRREIFEGLQQDDAGLGELDYETDVEPWLGQRMGVAMLPPVEGAPPESSFVLALQVTDQGQAQAGLERLLSSGADRGNGADGEGTSGGDGGETYGLVVGPDYALIAATQEVAQDAVDAAQDASLAEAEDFSADMAAIGEDGIAAFWVDVEAAGAAAEDFSGETEGFGAAAFRGSGRYAAVLRFDDRYVELAGGAFGVEQLVAPEGDATSAIGELPDSTVAAVSLSHGDQLVDAAWTSLRDNFASLDGAEDFDAAVAEYEASSGLSLPADLATMLGSNLLVALDEESLDEETRAEQGVTAGARITTDADAAEDVLDTLDQADRELGGEGLGIVRERTEDGVILASSQDYASRLAQDGSLGEDEVFALAVPDAEEADVALWADLEQILPVAMAELPDGEGQEFAEVLAGVGATMTIEDDGMALFTMRLVLR